MSADPALEFAALLEQAIAQNDRDHGDDEFATAITIKLMPGAAKEIFKDLTRLLKVDEDEFYRQRG